MPEDSPAVQALTHVALTVTDLEKSVAFYTDYFGFKVVQDLGTVTGEPFAPGHRGVVPTMKVAFLEDSSGATIEMFEYLEPKSVRDAHDRCNLDLGWTHIAFNVKGIEALYQRLVDVGVEMIDPAVEVFGPFKWAYLYGPDREQIELLEVG
ncbi:MAG: VOC family protein [Coriobacteriia bacterium]